MFPPNSVLFPSTIIHSCTVFTEILEVELISHIPPKCPLKFRLNFTFELHNSQARNEGFCTNVSLIV